MAKFWMKAWGTRGSLPVPGRGTLAFGGNTSCIEVRCGETRIAIDAGTGIVPLGRSWMGNGSIKGNILFSHLHWDHIQGFPFFSPAFVPGNALTIFSGKLDGGGARHALRTQMTRPSFPVSFAALEATISFKYLTPGDKFTVGEAQVRTSRLRHPGGAVGYRIEHAGHSMVYAVDTEHPKDGLDEDLVELARNTDLLIYDSAYTEDEYYGRGTFSRKGWGHSTWNNGVKVAQAAGVKLLALTHHDPSHDDRAVLAIHEQARQQYDGAFALFEGCIIDLLDPRLPELPKLDD